MTFTKREFKRWLEGQPKGRRFKRNCDSDCPLAEFLWHKTGEPIVVADEDISIGDGIPFTPPPWARQFVAHVDDSDRKTITAAEALELL